MNLKDIYPNFIIEDNQFECKALLNREDTLGWMKTINGFANAKGGTLFIGVKDKSYDLVGFDSTHADKEKLFLFNTIQQHFSYTPTIVISLIPYQIHKEERYIIKAVVSESKIKPLFIVYDKMPMAFMRRNGYTNPATTEELRAMFTTSDIASYDTQKTSYDFKESDFTKLYAFYAERNDGKVLTKKELASIGFFDEDNKLAQGAYLFSDSYQGDETKVVCSSYKGLTKGDDKILSSNTFTGNLLSVYEYIWEFLQQRMNHGFLKTATGRIDIDAYPSRALFEAIINALAHRDYFLKGSQISVDLFVNRLSISSPGSLYNAGELKPTYQFDSLISRRRNELLCSIFILCHAMEAKGTGFEKIKEDYKEENSSHQPFVFSRDNQFTIVLPDRTFESGVALSQEALTTLGSIQNESRFDLGILSFCYSEEKSIKEITEHLHISDSTFFRKNIIENLVKQNYLLESRVGHSKKYKSNPAYCVLN